MSELCSGIMQLMKHLDFLDEDLKQELLSMSMGSVPEAALVTWLSQAIDSRNNLTPEQLAEYEEMGDEVLSGEELDRKFNEIFPETEWYEINDDEDITLQVLDQADSHINVVSQLESTLRNKIYQLSMLDLEEKEKEIKVNMMCLKKDCQHLDKELCCIYSDLNDILQIFTKIPSRYRATNRSTMVETCKKHHKKFDKYLKMFIKRTFEDVTPFTERLGDDRLEEISASYVKIKEENLLLKVKLAGYEAALNELKRVMESVKSFKLILSFSDLSEGDLTKKLKVDEYKVELMQRLESCNEIILEVAAIETGKVQEAKAVHRRNQRQCILKYADILEVITNARLQTVELFLLMLIVEKQRLAGVMDLLTDLPKEVTEKYNAAVTRVETMQSLAGKKDAEPVRHPLIQCLSRIYLGKEAMDLSTLVSSSRSLDCEIKQLQQNLCNSINTQRTAYLNNYFAVDAAERLLCSGLTKKPQIESLTFFLNYSEFEDLVAIFRNKINELKSEVKKTQAFHARKPMLAERRLLWTYFLMDPGQFMEKIANAVEMAEAKRRERKTAMYHRSLPALHAVKVERI